MANWDFSKYTQSPPVPGPTGGPRDEGRSGGDFGPAQGPLGADYAFGPPNIQVSAPLHIGKPPVLWLAACTLVVVSAGLLAGLWGGSPRWAVLAWVASGPVAIGLLAAFNVFDTRARAQAAYSRPAWVPPAYVACLMLCGVAVCISAVRIAFWVGRL